MPRPAHLPAAPPRKWLPGSEWAGCADELPGTWRVGGEGRSVRLHVCDHQAQRLLSCRATHLRQLPRMYVRVPVRAG